MAIHLPLRWLSIVASWKRFLLQPHPADGKGEFGGRDNGETDGENIAGSELTEGKGEAGGEGENEG